MEEAEEGEEHWIKLTLDTAESRFGRRVSRTLVLMLSMSVVSEEVSAVPGLMLSLWAGSQTG